MELLRTTALLLALLLLPLGASAQQWDAASAQTAHAEPAERTDRRLYVGMWTLHFRDLDRGLDNNWVLGMSWGRVYGATFINSFGRRAYSVGMQETVARWRPELVSVGLGYRAGVVTGYTRRLFPLAGKTPVLPFIQPLLNLDAQRLGLELSYVWVIASASVNARF